MPRTKGAVNRSNFPEETKAQAKILYLQLYGPTDIAEKLRLPGPQTVCDWARLGKWRGERDRMIKKLFGNLYLEHVDTIKTIMGSGLTVLMRAMAVLMEREDPLSLKETKQLADVLDSVGKWIRLEEGKPTEIFKSEVSIQQFRENVKEFIKTDPFEEFADVIEVNKDGQPQEH